VPASEVDIEAEGGPAPVGEPSQPTSPASERIVAKTSLTARPGRLRRMLSRVPSWVWALAFYLVMAVVTIGRHALSHPATICACVGTEDPAAYMWALSWWPHAISHGLNPFVTHYLWAPTGVNVAQAAMIPTAAVAMAPITALAGPVVSYNILSLGSPALAAMTAYLLCRRLVGREAPAVAGGYLFGFSSYEFAQLTGHLNLTLVFLVPVMVHVALRRVDREISRLIYLIVMALMLVLQAGLSTELLAESVAFGAVILVSARFLAPRSHRSRIDGLMAETVAAGLVALVVASPFFYYALFSGTFPKGAGNLSDVYGLDLLNTLFPTYTTWLGHHDFLSLGLTYETGNITEADGYLGVPIVLAFLLWLLGDGYRSLLGRLLMVAVGVIFIVALGSHLHIAGQQTVTLPFNWVRHIPVFNNIVPSRIMLFATLAVAVGVAAWLAVPSRPTVVRWLVVLLGAIVVFPNLLPALYGVPPHNPRFFATSMYRNYLTRNETVLMLPYGTNDVSTLWQAETNFYFYMPEGYISGVVPPPFDTDVTVGQLVSNSPPPASALGSFIREHRVSDVVVDPALAGPWPGVLAQLGLTARHAGGIILYAVPGAPA
jgi:hypothetical protein